MRSHIAFQYFTSDAKAAAIVKIMILQVPVKQMNDELHFETLTFLHLESCSSEEATAFR